ncbi:MAG: CHASE sensor domain-containing protein, partial [Mariprofundus sp.]|nr:CHASE sensor domain-containing protein [Mariprofundus sp.]
MNATNSRTTGSRTIANKLRTMVMLISGMALGLVTVAFIIGQAIIYHDALVSRVQSMAQIIGINSSAALSFDDRDTAATLLTALKGEEDIGQATIYNEQGKLFARYSNALVMIDKPALANDDAHIMPVYIR